MVTFFIDVFVGGGGAAAGAGAERTFILLRVLYLLIAFATNCCYKRNGDTIGRPIVMVLLRASEATNERFVAHIGILRVSIGVDRPASRCATFGTGLAAFMPWQPRAALLVQQFVPLRGGIRSN